MTHTLLGTLFVAVVLLWAAISFVSYLLKSKIEEHLILKPGLPAIIKNFHWDASWDQLTNPMSATELCNYGSVGWKAHSAKSILEATTYPVLLKDTNDIKKWDHGYYHNLINHRTTYSERIEWIVTPTEACLLRVGQIVRGAGQSLLQILQINGTHVTGKFFMEMSDELAAHEGFSSELKAYYAKHLLDRLIPEKQINEMDAKLKYCESAINITVG